MIAGGRCWAPDRYRKLCGLGAAHQRRGVKADGRNGLQGWHWPGGGQTGQRRSPEGEPWCWGWQGYPAACRQLLSGGLNHKKGTPHWRGLREEQAEEPLLMQSCLVSSGRRGCSREVPAWAMRPRRQLARSRTGRPKRRGAAAAPRSARLVSLPHQTQFKFGRNTHARCLHGA